MAEHKINVYWDRDGDGWAWYYGDRSGAIQSTDREADPEILADLARDAVCADPTMPTPVRRTVNRIDVSVRSATDESADPVVVSGE